MFGTGLFSSRAAGWPGTCQVCGRWPAQPVCPVCEARFAAPRWRCRGCAVALTADASHCGACKTRQEPSALQRCVAAVDYAFPWDGLIARFKFREEPGWAGPFAELMLQHADARELLQACDLLVPVPVTPSRLAERGYNQSWALAKALQQRGAGDHPAPPALPDALVRVRETVDQHQLPRTKRLHNLRGAFVVHPLHAPRLAQTHVLLVDDVTTTGATLQAAAQALLHAGAARVSALVMARTPQD